MASKWLAAFRAEVEDGLFISETRAERVNSANSPTLAPDTRPNGTNGTAEQKEGEGESHDLSALKALLARPEHIQAKSPAPRDSVAVPGPEPGQEADQEADDREERAALVEFGAGVRRRWAVGFGALSTIPPPTGFSPDRWHRIVDAAGSFLDRWAAEAIAAGWSDLDVFGCDPNRPDARFDCMGLLMLLDRMEIVRIDAEGADLCCFTGAIQRFRRRPLPAQTVSLWNLIGGSRLPLTISQASTSKGTTAHTGRVGPAESTGPEGLPT